MLVELKNGETLNGHLANCDNWMNLVLKEVVQTSPDGDRFFKLPEVYVRGNNVRFPSSVYDGYSPDFLSGCRLFGYEMNPANHSALLDQIPTDPRRNYRHRQGAATGPRLGSRSGWLQR